MCSAWTKMVTIVVHIFSIWVNRKKYQFSCALWIINVYIYFGFLEDFDIGFWTCSRREERCAIWIYFHFYVSNVVLKFILFYQCFDMTTVMFSYIWPNMFERKWLALNVKVMFHPIQKDENKMTGNNCSHTISLLIKKMFTRKMLMFIWALQGPLYFLYLVSLTLFGIMILHP